MRSISGQQPGGPIRRTAPPMAPSVTGRNEAGRATAAFRVSTCRVQMLVDDTADGDGPSSADLRFTVFDLGSQHSDDSVFQILGSVSLRCQLLLNIITATSSARWDGWRNWCTCASASRSNSVSDRHWRLLMPKILVGELKVMHGRRHRQ